MIGRVTHYLRQRYQAIGNSCKLVAVVFAVALLESWLTVAHAMVPVVHLVPGLILAGVYTLARDCRLRFALAAFVAQIAALIVAGLTMTPAVWAGAGILAEAWIGAFLLRRLNPEGLDLTRARQILSLALVAFVIAPPLGLVIHRLSDGQGLGIVAGGGGTLLHPDTSGLLAILTNWILPQALGMILTVPLAFGFLRGHDPAHPARPFRERLIIQMVHALACVIAFSSAGSGLPLALVPTLLVVAIRLGIRDTAFAVLVAQLVAGFATARGLGPVLHFATVAAAQQLLLQLLFLCIYACLLPIAATLEVQRMLERQLASNLQFTDQIIRSMSEVVFRTDTAGRWTFLNPAWQAVTGYTVTESIGWDTNRLLSPASLSKALDAYPRLVRGEVEELMLEQQFIRKDGEQRSIEVNVRALRSSSGKFAGTAGSIRDITERHNLLEVLRTSERKFRDLCDTAPIGIIRTDPQGIITYANRMIELILLVPQAHLQGRDWLEFLCDETGQLQQSIVDEVNLPLVTIERELRVRDRANQIRWISVVITGEFDADARHVGHIAAIADITRRKEAEAELASTSRELSQLASNINDVVLRVGLDGVCRYVTPSVRTVLGFEPHHVIGSNVLSRIHPQDLPIIRDAFEQLAGGAIDDFSISYRSLPAGPDRDYIWLDSNCRLLRDKNGQPSEIIATSRDVTARKQLEIELVDARYRAEDAAHAKSAFLASTSHEIRTPMNGVIGLTELLLQQDLDETSRTYATLIRESGETMMALLNDVLDLAKIEAGQIRLVSERFDLHASLENALQFVAPRAAKAGLDARLAIAGDLPRDMMGDKLRLGQILANLLGNAVKFTPAGHIALSAGLDGDDLVIAVSDTGIGIAHDAQGTVFDDFVQADQHITSNYGGTGLGLSISRRLAEAMGGSLSLTSVPGAGTRVELRIPARFVAAAPLALPEPVDAPANQPARPLRILVAEDNRTNQIIIGGMLDRLGHVHAMADDGSAAIDQVQAAAQRGEPFDVVLMDIQMPGMDGIEAARALRAMGFDARQLPVIAVTASAFGEDVQLCHEAGMQGHVGKPIRQATLQAALQDLALAA
jgi:PAS domain S-box-containing protein